MSDHTSTTGRDVILSDAERRVIIDALHILATMVRRADGNPGVTVECWLGVARKLEGVDKQLVVRDLR